MRTLLFFDLPSVTKKEANEYRKFVKNIKKMGFYMLQESVYVKLSIDSQKMNSTIEKVKNEIPSKGNIIVLNLTEKQFASMQILLGENVTEVVNSQDRTIEL